MSIINTLVRRVKSICSDEKSWNQELTCVKKDYVIKWIPFRYC